MLERWLLGANEAGRLILEELKESVRWWFGRNLRTMELWQERGWVATQMIKGKVRKFDTLWQPRQSCPLTFNQIEPRHSFVKGPQIQLKLYVYHRIARVKSSIPCIGHVCYVSGSIYPTPSGP